MPSNETELRTSAAQLADLPLCPPAAVEAARGIIQRHGATALVRATLQALRDWAPTAPAADCMDVAEHTRVVSIRQLADTAPLKAPRRLKGGGARTR